MSLASQIIDQVISNADSLKDKAISSADQALSYASTMVYGVNVPFVKPNIQTEKPNEGAFTQDFRDLIKNDYNDIFDKLIELVPDEMEKFINNFLDPFDEEAWNLVTKNLKDSIKNGGVILPEEVEEQIIERAKVKVNLELERMVNSINNSNGAKGFSIPPIALSSQLAMARINSARDMGQVLGQVQVEQQKLRYDYVKFAIDKIIEMKKQNITYALSYIQNLLGASGNATQHANMVMESYTKFADNNLKYVNAINNFSQTEVDLAKTEYNGQIQLAQANLNGAIQGAKARADAAVQIANVVAQSAAAALSGLNAIGSDVSLENI